MLSLFAAREESDEMMFSSSAENDVLDVSTELAGSFVV